MTTIPPITNPLGRHWEQPSVDEILVNEDYAVMSRSSLQKLKNYSHTNPSGVYPGKMWRAKILVVDSPGKFRVYKNQLRWYGVHPDPGYCSNNYRDILLID